MQYELQTTLSFESHSGMPVATAISHLRQAIEQVLSENPEFAAVEQFMIEAGSTNSEILVGLRFDGVKAQYVEDAADEILEKALHVVGGGLVSEADKYREESVSLQPVLA